MGDLNMNDLLPVPLGRYRHYKGNEYTVIGTARHSETQAELVVYRPEYGDGGLWVRPKGMFCETVRVDGQDVPRFRRLDAVAAPTSGNLFADVPAGFPDEVVTTLLGAANVRIERIVSHGQRSPDGFWYDQAQHEWVVVLKGSARLQFEDRVVEMKVGDYIFVPAHAKHRVEWTTPDEPTIWLAVHFGP
jgi:cupin 2 domain-containing protein